MLGPERQSVGRAEDHQGCGSRRQWAGGRRDRGGHRRGQELARLESESRERVLMEYNVNISLPRSIVLEFVSKLHAVAFVMASKKYEPESPL